MSPPPFPLEAWAARSPRVRWPLVLLLLVLLIGLAGGIAGCGGGGDSADDAGPTTQPVDCKLHPEACQ